ncbi:muramidase family protein [Sulfuriroseicoccus oceanibius]|uniref:LysM peptidoglycan-binding domain-containing protein n=1 Tax=Sulfuriroseicoccus oceanibius TaxID=2707525 RepID=A0A6B3L5L3_9BACT|nr:LysM peptidoglycan-binding domain-containing protein [Sulfuriroseicoccus oceanibius]QQL45181.1 LysM peptidoglycan-binding domain-containing protein [Sulfuriroseicoccus oceanibius]
MKSASDFHSSQPAPAGSFSRRALTALILTAVPITVQSATAQSGAHNADVERTQRLQDAVDDQAREVQRVRQELEQLRQLLEDTASDQPVELPDEVPPAPSSEPAEQPEPTPADEPAPQPEPLPEPIAPEPAAEPAPEPAVNPTPVSPAPQPDPEPEERIVPAASHTIQRGETLSSIARQYGTTWQELAKINGIDDPGRLQLGQVLTLPGSVAVAEDPAPTPQAEPETAAAVAELAPPASNRPKEPATITVKSGDTLSAIARKHGTTVEAMLAANPGVVANQLRVGQKLVIGDAGDVAPPGERAKPIATRTYIVQEGETLYAIARKFGTTAEAIIALNQLPDANHIRLGQELKVPANNDQSSSGGQSPAPISPDDMAPYEVKPGETLYGIGRKFFLSPAEIARMNKLPANANLQAGQELVLPMHVMYSHAATRSADQ